MVAIFKDAAIFLLFRWSDLERPILNESIKHPQCGKISIADV